MRSVIGQRAFTVRIEIIYAAADFVVQLRCDVEEGATVGDALLQSGIYVSHPETKTAAVGIFARIVTAEKLLQSGDRIEIYRPLCNNPMEKRRQRAKNPKSS